MKASDHAQPLNDGDEIVITEDIGEVLQKCCECGAFHRITITDTKDGSIRLKFSSVDSEPEVGSPTKVGVRKGKI